MVGACVCIHETRVSPFDSTSSQLQLSMQACMYNNIIILCIVINAIPYKGSTQCLCQLSVLEEPYIYNKV